MQGIFGVSRADVRAGVETEVESRHSVMRWTVEREV